MFPHPVHGNPTPEHGLTILNAASSAKTLGVMLTIAWIGVPIVVAYSDSIYYIFRGKVRLGRMRY